MPAQAMSVIESFLQEMQITRADHLPIVALFCRRIGLIETVNRVVPNNIQNAYLKALDLDQQDLLTP